MKIRFDGVQVRYGDTAALTGFDLDVASGEWLGLIGPSGSGKTSALRAAAGFERIAGGRISLDDRPVAGERQRLPPEKRGPGFVFQAFALFPHLSVAENIAFGLRHQPRDARAERVRAMLALVELAGYADRSPSTLSGGQQQRVALARALAPEPPALLMDEPFGSLDPDLRGIVRARVVETLRARGCTVIFISHDIDEAFALGDRLAILRGGVLQQVATPEQAYDRPASAFVAGFLGPVNLIPGLAEGDRMRTPLGDLRLARAAHGPRLAVARPHRFEAGAGGAPAVVEGRVFRGPLVELSLRLTDADLPPLRVHLPAEHPARPGDRLLLSIDAPVETVPAPSDP